MTKGNKWKWSIGLLISLLAFYFVWRWFVPTAVSTFPTKVDFPYKDSLLAKADQKYAQFETDSALLEYKELAPSYLAKENWKAYVKCCLRIGACYRRLGEIDSALAYLTFGKQLAYEKLGPMDIVTAHSHHYLGEYYFDWVDPNLALEEFLKSKSLMDLYHSPYHPTRAYTLDQIGEVYSFYFRNGALSERYFREALDLREYHGEHHTSGIANNYYNLSIACFMKGEYGKALSLNEYSYRIFRDLEGHFESHISNNYSHAGNIWYAQKAYDKAVTQYQKAIDLLSQNPDYPSLLVNQYNNLGAAYLENAQVKEAKESIWISLSRNQGTDTLEWIKSIYNLGLLFEQEQNGDSAQSCYEKCHLLCTKFYPTNHPQLALVFYRMGILKKEQGEGDAALQLLQRSLCTLLPSFHPADIYAIPSKEEIEHPLQLLDVLQEKASLLEKMYSDGPIKKKALETALGYYLLSEEVLIKNRASYERDEAKLYMSEIHQHIYEETLRYLWKLHALYAEPKYLGLVFQTMERSKSALLQEALAKAKIMQEAQIPDSLRKEEKTLKIALEETNFLLKMMQRAETSEKWHHLDSTRLQQERSLEKWKQKWSKSFPEYFLPDYTTKEKHIADIQNEVKEDEVIVEYYWGKQALYSIAIFHDAIELHEVKRKDLLEKQVKDFFKMVNDSHVYLENSEREKQASAYASLGKGLFDSILSPFLHREISTAAIIPDGPLCQIPFEALVENKPVSSVSGFHQLDYILKKYQISYAHSCQILFSTSFTTSWWDKKSLLFLSYPSGAERKKNEENPAFFLPNAAMLPLLSKELGATYQMATKENLRTNLPYHDMVHFHVHASADTANTANSKFLFVQEKNPQKEDPLYSHEIYGMNFKDKWVMLNACETAIGKHYQGEGVYSLARGFSYAGSNGVFTGLWKLNETPTFEITKHFYHNLQKNGDVEQAFHQAKRDFLQNQDNLTAHPSYWAGTILINNSRERKKYDTLVAIFLVVFFATCLWYGRKKAWDRSQAY